MRNVREATVLKATGTLSGVSDIVLIHSFIPKGTEAMNIPDYKRKLAFVEIKTEIGRQNIAQMDFERRVADLGYIYRIIRSLDEFKNLIAEIES
ncbi:MAG: hypothetical protein AABY22_06365 [Nanoarchaeota archaeon]